MNKFHIDLGKHYCHSTCGKQFMNSQHAWANGINMTKDESQVTCKTCIKCLAARNRNDLIRELTNEKYV